MKKISVFLAIALLAGLSGTAAARDNFSFSVSIGAPAYPIYSPPAPVYYPAPRVYYAPSPFYYAPPPVYYAPAPLIIRDRHDWHRRDWNRRDWHRGHRH